MQQTEQFDMVNDQPIIPIVEVGTKKKRKNSYATFNQNAGFRNEVVAYTRENNLNLSYQKYMASNSTIRDWIDKDD
jgi:hypothetical protein